MIINCGRCSTLGVPQPDNLVYCKALDRSFKPDAECCLTMEDAVSLNQKYHERLQEVKNEVEFYEDACKGLRLKLYDGFSQ